MRAIGATEEYCIDVILQDRQFPFVLADYQTQNPLREVCRSGEVPNLFKEGGSVRVARIAMLPPGQLTDNFLRCLAEESLILDHIASGAQGSASSMPSGGRSAQRAWHTQWRNPGGLA